LLQQILYIKTDISLIYYQEFLQTIVFFPYFSLICKEMGDSNFLQKAIEIVTNATQEDQKRIMMKP